MDALSGSPGSWVQPDQPVRRYPAAGVTANAMLAPPGTWQSTVCAGWPHVPALGVAVIVPLGTAVPVTGTRNVAVHVTSALAVISISLVEPPPQLADHLENAYPC